MKHRAIYAIPALLAASCANAQSQEQQFDFENPSPMECAALHQQNLMFYIQGITEYQVENDLLGDPDTLIGLIVDRNRFLELEADRRGIEGMFRLSQLDSDLYAAHNAFREASEAIIAEDRADETNTDDKNRAWLDNLIRACERLVNP